MKFYDFMCRRCKGKFEKLVKKYVETGKLFRTRCPICGIINSCIRIPNTTQIKKYNDKHWAEHPHMQEHGFLDDSVPSDYQDYHKKYKPPTAKEKIQKISDKEQIF